MHTRTRTHCARTPLGASITSLALVDTQKIIDNDLRFQQDQGQGQGQDRGQGQVVSNTTSPADGEAAPALGFTPSGLAATGTLRRGGGGRGGGSGGAATGGTGRFPKGAEENGADNGPGGSSETAVPQVGCGTLYGISAQPVTDSNQTQT